MEAHEFTFVWVSAMRSGGKPSKPGQLEVWRPAMCSHCVLWASLEAFGFRNRLGRSVPFDEMGRKVIPPSHISVDFRNFTGIFLLLHFLLALPSSRTFFNGRALKFQVS